jgi:hypothetical protein
MEVPSGERSPIRRRRVQAAVEEFDFKEEIERIGKLEFGPDSAEESGRLPGLKSNLLEVSGRAGRTDEESSTYARLRGVDVYQSIPWDRVDP